MGKHAFGTTLNWDSAVVAGLTNIGGVDVSVSKVDSTTHASADAYKEFELGLLDAGDVAISGYFDYTDTAGQHAMLADMNARSKKTAIITFPVATGTTWTFTAGITGLKIGDAEIDGLIPFSATLSISGKPTFAVAAVTGMSAIGFSNDVLIMPAFAIGTFEYVVTITAGQTSTVITPVDATSGEVITITTDGAASQVVATGEASSACVLDVDDITEIVVTITKPNYAPKVYKFHCAVLAA